jgi:hypothetical protein
MKKVLLLFCMIISVKGYPQISDNTSWSPPGARWVYRLFSQNDNRFIELTYVKDTVMLNKTAKQMQVRFIKFLGPQNEVRIVDTLGKEYYYNSNDSIYYLDNGQFHFIYNFNPVLGDKWIIGNAKSSCIGNASFAATDTFTITSITPITFGNRIFNFIKDSSTTGNWDMGGIIKNIGSYITPFPQVSPAKCTNSSAYYGSFFLGLECYFDNVRGTVPVSNNSVSLTCNYIITAITPIAVISAGFKVYPNPAHNLIKISGQNNVKFAYSIFDISGKIILIGVSSVGEIQVSNLNPGLYFLQVSQGGKSTVSKFIKL